MNEIARLMRALRCSYNEAKQIAWDRLKRGRLPSSVGYCPGCGAWLDYEVDGGSDGWVSVSLICIADCDGPGLQSEWQPVIDAAEKWVNQQLGNGSCKS